MTNTSNLATRHYTIEQKMRKYDKGYELLSIAKNMSNKYGKQLLNTVNKNEENVEAVATVEFLGSKMA